MANFIGQNIRQKLERVRRDVRVYSNGKIVGSSLEASNADIADRFIKPIVTQQAYSANTKIITTGDKMVQALLSRAAAAAID